MAEMWQKQQIIALSPTCVLELVGGSGYKNTHNDFNVKSFNFFRIIGFKFKNPMLRLLGDDDGL